MGTSSVHALGTLLVRALFGHFLFAGKKCSEKRAQKVLINISDRKAVRPVKEDFPKG